MKGPHFVEEPKKFVPVGATRNAGFLVPFYRCLVLEGQELHLGNTDPISQSLCTVDSSPSTRRPYESPMRRVGLPVPSWGYTVNDDGPITKRDFYARIWDSPLCT
jgi:hypothetical protein